MTEEISFFRREKMKNWIIGIIVITIIALTLSQFSIPIYKDYAILVTTFLLIITNGLTYYYAKKQPKVQDVSFIAKIIADRWYIKTDHHLDYTNIRSRAYPPSGLWVEFISDVRSFLWDFVDNDYKETETKTIDMIFQEREESEMVKEDQKVKQKRKDYFIKKGQLDPESIEDLEV